MGKDGEAMTDRKARIEKLDYAITTLNDDAEDMRSLIDRSTEELERATSASQRAVDVAEESARQMSALADKMKSQLESEHVALKELRSAVADQRAATAEGLKSIKDGLDAERKADREVFNKVSCELKNAYDAECLAFDAFSKASLKAAEKTRDDLQSDFLSHKTATAARIDSLENEISKLQKSVNETESSLLEKVEGLQKRVSLPLYGVIAVAALQVVTLIALFMR